MEIQMMVNGRREMQGKENMRQRRGLWGDPGFSLTFEL